MRLTRSFLTSAALLLWLSTAHAAGAPIDAAAWRADLRRIAIELPQRHPNAFHRMSRSAWDSSVARIERRLPTMTRNQAIVAFMQLVAQVRDGHTSINPLFDPALQFRYYPIELYSYEDGLFVRSAPPAQAALVGAKVTKIGRLSAEDAMVAAGSTVPVENGWWGRAWATERLVTPEVLDGLGIADDMEKLPLEIERNGKKETVTIAPAGKMEPRGHDPRGAIDRSSWKVLGADASQPLWQRNPDQPYWFEYVAPQKTLYVCYRMVMDRMGHRGPQSGTNNAFWRSVFAAADSLEPEKLVIDLRENTGGNNFLNRQVVRGLVRRSELDNPSRLYVVIGRRTFSAAMNLAQDLEKWTNATFVGEPTGNATFFYGDHTQFELPNSHITVNVSSLPWRPYDPRDKRDYIAPMIYAPLTARDEREGTDPAWTAIFAAQGPRFTETMEKAAVAGDTATVEKVLRAERDKVANRFRPGEADANTLGYSLLNSGRSSAALIVFRAITRVYPQSANAWDSLGEGLLLANQHKDAVAAYQRALELNPNQQSARQALERLAGGRPPGH